MLIAILGLYFVHGQMTELYTFNYFELLGTPLTKSTAFLLMLGFFIAFAVKLPTVPFHTWLADAHTEAPTAGSVILAGLLLKTGGYGLIRFILPLFPEASKMLAPIAMTLGVIGIIYGGMLAFSFHLLIPQLASCVIHKDIVQRSILHGERFHLHTGAHRQFH